MTWTVRIYREFEPEFAALPADVRLSIDRQVAMLKLLGPDLRRPHVGTLKGSRINGLKELRPANAWRVAFVFDPRRDAILLLAANKRGVNKDLFYDRFKRLAEKRYARHLKDLENEK